LCEPERAGLTFRQIASLSGVSLGTVQQVMDELTIAGYVHKGRAGRSLIRPRDLFNRWVEAYALSLESKLWLADFDAADDGWWLRAERDLRAAGVQLGGESAAHVLGAPLRTSRAVLYANRIPDDLAVTYRWRAAAGAGDVEVRRRFWRDDGRAAGRAAHRRHEGAG